eukprot:15181_1
MIHLLKQHTEQLTKERDELLLVVGVQYTAYIHALLQQKEAIREKIRYEYEQLINDNNERIYDTFNNELKKNTNITQELFKNVCNVITASNFNQLLDPICNTLNNLNHTQNVNTTNTTNDNIHNETENEEINNITIISNTINQNVNNNIYKCDHDRSQHKKVIKYACMYCDKLFKSPSTLKTHIKTHIRSHERSSKCYKCNKSYADLKKHMNQVHTNNGKYACKYCSKRFTTPSTLTRHIRFHTKEKPFKCTKCNKSFSQKHHVKRHDRIHTGEKPFSCNKCGKEFTNSGTRNKHQKLYCKTSQIV